MSLIIATAVKDGIVVAADTRITCRDSEGNCRYSDTGEKLIPFPNKIVVLSCGDADINNKLSVKKFLYDLRNEIGKESKINDLPLKILNSYCEKGGCRNILFIVAGVSDFLEDIYVYVIKTKTKEIKLEFCNNYGSVYQGITNIAHSIMSSGINYQNLTLMEAVELTKNCLEENIFLSKFNREQGIGGKCQVYVIDIVHQKVGWLNEQGELEEDKDASPIAYELLKHEELKKIKENFNKNS